MKKKVNFADIIIYVTICVFAISCLIPILNTIAISMSDKTSAALGQVYFLPKNFNIEAYKEILKDNRFFTAFGVSVERVIIGTILNTFLSILMAYPLSKSPEEFPMRNFYMWFMVITMLFYGGLVPSFLLVKELNLLDTMWALVLPGAVNVFNTIILINFFKGIPKSLEEAAVVDGANPLFILFKIFVPLSKAAIATIALFAAVYHWNSFFDGKIYINSPLKIPLQTYIQSLTFTISVSAMQNMSPDEIIRKLKMSDLTFSAAKAIISMIPIIAVYPFVQKYFVTGIVLGAVKE